MKKVKALWTIHGSYGTKKAGDEFEVQDSVAGDLEEKGAVKILEEEIKEKAETSKAGDITSEKVNIKDATVKTEKKQILKPGNKK